MFSSNNSKSSTDHTTAHPVICPTRNRNRNQTHYQLQAQKSHNSNYCSISITTSSSSSSPCRNSFSKIASCQNLCSDDCHHPYAYITIFCPWWRPAACLCGQLLLNALFVCWLLSLAPATCQVYLSGGSSSTIVRALSLRQKLQI